MANVFAFEGIVPVVDESAFIHPNATVIGRVVIGKDVYIGPNATLRGDWGEIIIEDGCNVQESCVVHMFPGLTVHLSAGAHVGHGAVIHGAKLGRNCLIGMNAVLMDNVTIGEESIVGALSFVPEGFTVERRSVVVGNPAKRIKEVTDEMLEWKTKGTSLYQQLPAMLRGSLVEAEPLRSMPANRPALSGNYQPWHKSKEDIK